MSEKVRLIKFEHFRGLPANEFKLKGKSLVLLGANGKGKSALVDGIEFVFSGEVARFTGAGTGSIPMTMRLGTSKRAETQRCFLRSALRMGNYAETFPLIGPKLLIDRRSGISSRSTEG